MNAKENRVANLRRLIGTRFAGNAGQCADYLGIKRPQVSRWVTANNDVRQGIAEDSARMIESKLGLASGWLDRHHPDATEPEVDNEILDATNLFINVYRHTTTEGRMFLLNSVKAVQAAFVTEDRRKQQDSELMRRINNRRKL